MKYVIVAFNFSPLMSGTKATQYACRMMTFFWLQPLFTNNVYSFQTFLNNPLVEYGTKKRKKKIINLILDQALN